VIPSIMLGSAVTGSLSMAFGATLRAPHGGIFVLPLIGNPLLFLVALIAGTLVAAGSVIALKQVRFRAVERSAAVSGQPVNA